MEKHGFLLNRRKAEYMKYKFIKRQTNLNVEVKIIEHNTISLPFKSLWSIIQIDGQIDEDIDYRIQVGVDEMNECSICDRQYKNTTQA